MPLHPPAKGDPDAHLQNVYQTVNGLRHMLRHSGELSRVIGYSPTQLLFELQTFYEAMEREHGVKMPNLRGPFGNVFDDELVSNAYDSSSARLPDVNAEFQDGRFEARKGNVETISEDISNYFGSMFGFSDIAKSIAQTASLNPFDFMAGSDSRGAHREGSHEPGYRAAESAATSPVGATSRPSIGDSALLAYLSSLVQCEAERVSEVCSAGVRYPEHAGVSPQFVKKDLANVLSARLQSSLAREAMRDFTDGLMHGQPQHYVP
eukprot:Selendium_serpulae@DN3769_c0_g1_i1.p2